MNKTARTTTARVVAGGLACLVLLPVPSSAEGTDKPAFSLAISPVRLVVDQADVATTQEIKVINGGTQPMQVTVEKQNFVADRAGTLQFQESAPYSASTWVTVTPTTFEVPAGQTQVVSATIDVPADPEPGDHTLALVFLVPAGESASNVRINRGIGSPVFITVPGPIDASAAVTDLDAGGFVTGGPVDVRATIEDTGTVHRDFRGLTPLLLEASGGAEPFPDFTVMRGGTRDITTTWNPPLMCICHPSVTVANADGTESTRSVRVVVFPLWWALGTVGVLLLLVAGAWLVRRRFRASVLEAAAALGPPAGAGVV
jgi:hypothetical protein